MRTTVSSLLVLGMMSTTTAAQAPQPAVATTAASAAATTTASAAADQAAAPADSPKRITVTVGFDVLTAYVFRGIHQESEGFAAQPPLDVGIALGKGITANFGNWYSLHSGPSGNFYESDTSGSVTFTAGKLKPGVLFTSYTSPNDRFRTVHELAAVVAVDDSASPLPLSPKATLAFELDGQADGGSAKGTYLELAVRPSIKLIDARSPLSLAIPVRLGVSLKDYYEGPNGSETFGFFSSGLVASVPVTTRNVTWDFHGGVDLLWFGDNMKVLNRDDGFKPVGVIGITLIY
jgi:hypothetical protein